MINWFEWHIKPTGQVHQQALRGAGRGPGRVYNLEAVKVEATDNLETGNCLVPLNIDSITLSILINVPSNYSRIFPRVSHVLSP